MTDTFDADVAKCYAYIDSMAAMTGRHIGTTQSIVSDYTSLISSNARLKAEKEILKRDNNRLKRWIAKIN